MDFTARDFETATSSFTSVCSLGWCVVKNSRIVRREEILVRPEPFEFNEYNIKIHGIRPEMVKDMPTFDAYWERIRPDIENRMVVAHNASFDVRVLCQTLQNFGIDVPEFSYMCTVKLSQKAYPELESHRLNKLCDALGITFNHHQAYDDAYACARALLRIAEDYSLKSFEDIEECFDIKRGEVHPGMDFSTKKSRHPHKRRKIHNLN
ncbi:MAG: 3'-5' exonuclease [Candidatus Ornithomonoglobus sp.]